MAALPRLAVLAYCLRLGALPWPFFHTLYWTRRRLLVVLGLQDFTATVETVRADVVTQVGFAGGRLDCQVRCGQEIVRTVHAALRRGLLILLNCHDDP